MQTAMRYSRDEDDACNIVTLAFVKLFRSLQSYDSSKGAVHAWIKRIVINESLDFIKSRQKFSQYEEIETTTQPVVDNALVEKLSAAELLQLIRQLPPATQTVFNLYAIEGYNHREIAKMVGISEGTSKWHLSNARKLLQEQILDANNR
jgi:RNA polymerase sigma factor (sigma-70 family)